VAVWAFILTAPTSSRRQPFAEASAPTPKS
jgi:hypothetical protein